MTTEPPKRFFCTGCGVHYGTRKLELVAKPKPGLGSGCWELALAKQRYEARRLYVAQCTTRGTPPAWEFDA